MKANYVPYGEKPSELLPPLAYTADESATISDIGTVINSYVEQMIARFISGDANINTDWNSFVAQLDTKGLPKLLAAEQKAYDAKYKK